jgi:hypothetical protein
VVFRNIKDFFVWDWPGHRAKYKVGRHNQSGYNINIETDTEGWAWAAINNAAYDYYRMCEATGIANPPKQLKIYDANGATGGQSSAPMISRFPALRLFTHTNWVTFVFWGNIGSPSPIEAIFGIDSLLWLFMPDLIIYTQDSDYGDIFNTVSHELAHASHFSKVGGDYWANYVDHIVDKSGYGDTRSGNNAGYCEVGEMWGHAMGDILHSEQFDENRLSQPYFVHNMNFRGTTFWIHPDPIWALITRGVLTKKQVFDSMTSDVDTVEKWINKLCSGKATETANAIRTAFAHDDVPVIQGTNPSSINANATYTVPAEENMPDNFTFNGWTVTPDSGYTITGGTTSRDLTIKFTSSGTYTLTANFQLPDGTDYAATKSFTLKPPPPPTPIIAASHEYIPKGSVVTFNVTNAGNPEYSYVWEIDGELVFTPGGGPSLSIIAGASNNPVLFGLQDPKLPIDPEDPPGGPTIYKIIYARCRAQHGGVYSQWSSTISVAVTNN